MKSNKNILSFALIVCGCVHFDAINKLYCKFELILFLGKKTVNVSSVNIRITRKPGSFSVCE